MTPFGEHVRQLREARNISQKEMAQALGVSAAYLSALEHGKRGVPSYAFLQRIAGYFNVIWDDADQLHRLAELSNPKVVVETMDLSANATRLANVLAKEITKLDETEILQLLDRLEGVSRSSKDTS